MKKGKNNIKNKMCYPFFFAMCDAFVYQKTYFSGQPFKQVKQICFLNYRKPDQY